MDLLVKTEAAIKLHHRPALCTDMFIDKARNSFRIIFGSLLDIADQNEEK